MRRIAEVILDPVMSKAAAKATLPPDELAALNNNTVETDPDSIDVPLGFESNQQDQPAPPTNYVSREYVWGPGDNGVDELLCQWAFPSRQTPWWVLGNAGGDSVALVTQATVGTPSRVAWQATYDAYGQVIASSWLAPHPSLYKYSTRVIPSVSRPHAATR
ncbi:MAG: hypothetical protein ACK5RX_07490 [bacterium]|jgi:hypothetical protein